MSVARDGGTPNVRLNARENTSADDQPSSAATAVTDSPRCRRQAARSSMMRRRSAAGDSPVSRAHFPGEVEFRRVTAARHVADVGVVGVDDRVEQFPQSVAACWIAHVHRVWSAARRMDMTIPAALVAHYSHGQ